MLKLRLSQDNVRAAFFKVSVQGLQGKTDAKVKQTSAKDSISSRRGICQMFYTSKIPKEFNVTRKTCKSKHFWQTIENGWWMFSSSFLNELSVLQLFTQIQNHSGDFVKALL